MGDWDQRCEAKNPAAMLVKNVRGARSCNCPTNAANLRPSSGKQMEINDRKDRLWVIRISNSPLHFPK